MVARVFFFNFLPSWLWSELWWLTILVCFGVMGVMIDEDNEDDEFELGVG